MTDKGLFAIGIKEGPVMNHADVRECSWKGAKVGRYARLEEVISARKPWRVYPVGSAAVGRAGPRQSKRNVELPNT